MYYNQLTLALEGFNTFPNRILAFWSTFNNTYNFSTAKNIYNRSTGMINLMLLYDKNNPVAGLVGLRPGGFNVLFCDGSVHFISTAVDPELLRRLFTRNDGQVIRYEELMGPGPRGGVRPVPTSRPPRPAVAEEIEAVEEEPEEEFEILPRR